MHSEKGLVITSYIIGILLFTLSSITTWAFYLKAKNAGVQAENIIHIANVKDLTSTVRRQLKTIGDHKTINRENTLINRDLHSEIGRIRKESFTYQQEIQERRANEFNNALAEPFRSGNVARANLNKLLCLFASQDTNCHDTDITGSRDPPTPNGTTDEDPAGVDTIKS